MASSVCIHGPARSGKTMLLAEWAQRLTPASARTRTLRIASSASCGSTFVDVACAILERHAAAGPVLTADEQEALAAGLLASEGPTEWPTLHPAIGDPAFALELAATVCAYQASFLGLEELRTHTHAAGQPDRWEELAAFAERYLDALRARGVRDWAGALVEASLLLRHPEIRRAETEGLAAVLVDDWETATFATNRILSQLAGPAGDVPVIVAGNAATAVSGSTGANPAYLARFPRRFAGARTVVLDQPTRPRPRPSVIGDGGQLAGALVAAYGDGVAWEDMAVIVRDRSRLAAVVDALRTGDVPAQAESATTRWEPAGPVPPGVVAVATLEVTPSRSWPLVVVEGCRRRGSRRLAHRWFDLELLAGPDVPSAAERLARAAAEDTRAFELATSRAYERLLLAMADKGHDDDEGGFVLPPSLTSSP
jgi:superfamily I DNA/RNA helicase